jgi:NADPH-dependent curcumin reductase CurA
VINYRQESLKAVLKKEYPEGVDCVYESGACFYWRWRAAAGGLR